MSSSTKSILILVLAVFGIAAVFWYGPLFLKSDKRNEGPQIGCKDCNLIMISLSNVSAEHMNVYGYERLTTPQLTEWAKDAVVFKNAFTQTSWTLPVATSLFTSLYPYSHKIMDRFVDQRPGEAIQPLQFLLLDRQIQTLPEILRDEGYKTAAFVGGLDYTNGFGHMRGFEEFGEAADLTTAIQFAGFQPTLTKAREWLGKNSKEKFFLFIHGYDTHCPFAPPEHLKGTFSRQEGKNTTVDSKLCLRGFKDPESQNYEAYYYRKGPEKVILTKDDITYLEELYDEEILSVDELVGNFLDTIEETIPENTIIVVFSDHGEMFAKHGRFGRAGAVRGTLYDDVAHIPLIMKVPKQKGKTAEGLVQTIDVMPTLLDVLGIPKPTQLQGKSLVSLLKGENEDINQYVFAGSRFGLVEGRNFSLQIFPWKSINESVRTKNWKLIHETTFGEGGEPKEDTYELYNLKDDPDELHNLALQQPALTAELKEVLENWAEAATSYTIKNLSSPGLLPQEIIESAKEHGYW